MNIQNKQQLYRLYIDESGDHRYGKRNTFVSSVNFPGGRIEIPSDEYPELSDIRNRYLSLTGCIIESKFYSENFKPNMEELKKRYFTYDPDEPIIFHREDMVQCRNQFWRLKEKDVRELFNADLLSFLKSMSYKIITVVIDKQAHIQKYGTVAFHPYHYCLTAMLERYCGFLSFYNAKGDILAESRGGREDEKLKEAYDELYSSGSSFRNKSHFQNTLTSKHIKLQKKEKNIAGLQLSDLIAHPSKRDILSARGHIALRQDFGTEVIKAVECKFNKHHYSGKIDGYGKVFL